MNCGAGYPAASRIRQFSKRSSSVRNGSRFPLRVEIGVVELPDGRAFLSLLSDISERKAAEEAIREADQLLKDHLREIQLLSEMNKALLHATTEEELLREYCRILVEIGGYRAAWVGFADTGLKKQMIPVAHYGYEGGLLHAIKVTWDDSVYGNGAAGSAVKSGKIVMIEDFANDARTRPWHSEGTRLGYRSAIAIPFHHSPEGMACLTAYGTAVHAWSDSELKLMEQIASALGFGITTLRTAIARDRYQQDLHTSLEQTIEVISETVDQRDPYTTGHQKRVADLCSRIAAKMKLEPYRIQGLRLAATIHDLGKIGIPAEILAKPGKLTPIQYELIKEHPQLGHDIVKNVSFPWSIGEMILQHHERMDGSGYPQGLRGDAILPEARILAVADVVEAMGSHRPYRAARGIDVALNEILKGRRKLYDPEAVDACLSVFRDDRYRFPE